MKLSKKLLSLLLCAIMVLGSVAIGGEGFAKVLDVFSVKASAASYPKISALKVPRIKQISGDSACYLCSICSVEAFHLGNYSGTSFSYGTDYAQSTQLYVDMKKSNNGKVGYGNGVETAYNYTKDTSPTLAEIYTQLSKGKPVVVYAQKSSSDATNCHASVIIGYNGSSSTLEKSGFTVMEINASYWTNSKSYFDSYANAPQSYNTSGGKCYVTLESWLETRPTMKIISYRTNETYSGTGISEVPVLSVSGGTSITKTNFSWNKVSNATNYCIKVYNPADSSLVLSSDNSVNLSANDTSWSCHLDSGNYFAQLVAVNGSYSNWNSWSSMVYFSVAYTSTPSVPVLTVNPGSSNTITKFTWPSALNTTNYVVRINDPNNNAILFSSENYAFLGKNDTSWSFQLEAGEYFAQLIAINGSYSNGNNWSQKVYFTVTYTSIPGRPIINVSSGYNCEPTYFDWPDIVNTTNYIVRINDPTDDSILVSSDRYVTLDKDDTSWSFQLEAGEYFAQLIAVNETYSNGNNWSDRVYFTVKNETIPPDVSYTISNNLDSCQTLSIDITDNYCLASMYLGTSTNYLNNEYTNLKNDSSVNPSNTVTEYTMVRAISNPGTYYLTVLDYSGNKYNSPAIILRKTTLNVNGGSTSISNVLTADGKSFKLPSATKTGYSFKGWNTKSDGTGTNYSSGASYKPTSNTTLYAIWEANKYTVAFNANGGSGAPSSQTKSYGTSLTLSSTKPTRTGYTFKNWNTKADGTGTSYSSGASYTANAAVTLYAQWTANTYAVTYNANGGSDAPSSQTKTYDKTLTLSSTKPTRTGYTFKNWNTKADGTGTSYSAGASYTANAAVTLYAQWTANSYAVTYNANGGSGAPANQTKTEGTTLTLSSTKPTREGYTFLGWAETSTATTAAYQAGGSFTKDANTTLYAVWNKNAATYTVKYDANGGSGAPASQTKIEGTTLALSSTKPTRTGYTFKNWNTKADGTGTSYSAGASYTANAAVTLYAQWTENHTHNYTKSVTKPTCTQQGYTTYTCSCGETYKSDYVSALGHNYVNGICTGCGDISSEYSLAEAKQIAKSELETARNNAISNEAKGILDFAIITVDSAASIDEVNNIKANAIKAANDADASYFNDNKLNNANINIASEKNFDYRSIVTITATATSVPEGYKLALYVNGSKVAEGDNKSVSYSVGELKSNVNYSVKVLDNNGNVQKDSNGNELSKDSKITVNAGFFKKLIAFFKGLFKSLPKVEVKP